MIELPGLPWAAHWNWARAARGQLPALFHGTPVFARRLPPARWDRPIDTCGRRRMGATGRAFSQPL